MSDIHNSLNKCIVSRKLKSRARKQAYVISVGQTTQWGTAELQELAHKFDESVGTVLR